MAIGNPPLNRRPFDQWSPIGRPFRAVLDRGDGLISYRKSMSKSYTAQQTYRKSNNELNMPGQGRGWAYIPILHSYIKTFEMDELGNVRTSPHPGPSPMGSFWS